MQLFYAPCIETDPVLPEEESGHAIRVLRLSAADEIRITDGKGFFYTAEIINAHPKHCEVYITDKQPQKPLWPVQIHIAIAPPKLIDRMEWFVEKAVEIGIDAITCLECRFSERKTINTTRLEKIMVSAMKQSLQARLPRITGMTALQDLIRQPFHGSQFIAHCAAGEKSSLKLSYRAGENALILIGPEGDFSPEEISLAVKQGFQPVTLGPNRLRTETAAFVACHTVHLINNYELRIIE